MTIETQGGKKGRDPGRDPKAAAHDLSRTIQYYGLLMGVIGCVNLWLYWAEGMRLSLYLGIACFVCLVAWMLFARRQIR